MERKNIAETHFQKDGYLAWVVCLAAFLTNVVITGIDSSFGETIGSIQKDFNATEGEVAWIGSIHSSAQYFAAFAASPLANHFGFAPVTVAGTVISIISLGIALTSPNIPSLTATYGLLGGIGLGLSYTPANVVCAFHFDKNEHWQ